jgi:hypothetical protein
MRFVKILVFLLFYYFKVSGQSFIDNNDWTYHNNLKDVETAALYENKIFCFNKTGFFLLDLYDYNLISNLKAFDFKSIEFDVSFSDSNYLITGNNSGLIQIISGEEIFSLNLNEITTNFKINSFNVFKNTLYVSSSEGLFKVDLEKKLVKDKYYSIGEGGIAVEILDSKIINDSLYIISDKSIYSISLESNLLDYNLWTKKNLDLINIKGAFIKDQDIYFYSSQAIVNTKGETIYYQEDIDINQILIDRSEIHLIYSYKEKIHYGILIDKHLNPIPLPETINEINDFLIINNEMWFFGNNFSSYNLNQDQFFSPENKLAFDPSRISSLEDSIYAFSNSNKMASSSGYTWENNSFENFSNITSVEYFNNFLFFGSEKDGILNVSENFIIDQNFKGSLLSELPDNSINISDLKAFSDKMWILNYGSKNPLISLDNNYNWNSYSLGNINEIFPVQFKFVNDQEVFIILDKSKGGGILLYNIEMSQAISMTSANGRLNSNLVNDIDIDKNGLIWVASDNGLIYFLSHHENEIDDYFIPNDGAQNVFQNINISSLLIDNANIIWIGTDDGLFLYDHDKNQIINQFTIDNSSLLSNKIIDIHKRKDGEIYILTDKGLSSISTYIINEESSYENLIFYPNPLKLKEHNKMIFSGLQSENYIKIISLSGEEIIQLNVTGGGYSWNLNDIRGKKIVPGTYLIFILSEYGGEGQLAGKFLVL